MKKTIAYVCFLAAINLGLWIVYLAPSAPDDHGAGFNASDAMPGTDAPLKSLDERERELKAERDEFLKAVRLSAPYLPPYLPYTASPSPSLTPSHSPTGPTPAPTPFDFSKSSPEVQAIVGAVNQIAAAIDRERQLDASQNVAIGMIIQSGFKGAIDDGLTSAGKLVAVPRSLDAKTGAVKGGFTFQGTGGK